MGEAPDAEDVVEPNQPLPGADNPYIDREKVVEYALNREHPVGRHKAKVFQKALDIEKEDAAYLIESIERALPVQPVSGVNWGLSWCVERTCWTRSSSAKRWDAGLPGPAAQSWPRTLSQP